MQNSLIRKQHCENAEEKHRAGSAWRQAGLQLLEIMRLHQMAKRQDTNLDELNELCQVAAAGGLSVRSGWSCNFDELEAEQFRIDLAGGGPAVRIVGNLARFGHAEDARLEYQDWGTPWLEFRLLNDYEINAVSWFCNQFYWPGN